jgi:competence protein ComEC
LWREAALFLAALLAGAVYYHAFFRVKTATTNLPMGRSLTFSAVIVDEPQPTEKYLLLTARAQPPLRGTLAVFAPLDAIVAYGDLVAVSGTMSPADRPNGDPVMFSPRITFVAAHKGFFFREWMIRVKDAVLASFQQALPEDEAALLGGITFGARTTFAPDLKNAMALSGTTHLVAVSGYNITIVIVAAGALFGRFFSRRITVALAVVFLLCFMFMVGAMASAVRAAIMGVMALIAREAGEAFSMRNPIAFTALAMTLLDPSVLTADIGFILSFASLLGIVYVGPPLRTLLGRERSAGVRSGMFDWRESATMTLSAQLAVMPILVKNFGQFSLAAVGSNILILSVVPLTMFFGFFLAALSLVAHTAVFFAAKLVALLLGYQLFVIRLFAKLAVPFPFRMDSAFALIFYYLVLAAFVFSRYKPSYAVPQEI